jgi:hypothetical protein
MTPLEMYSRQPTVLGQRAARALQCRQAFEQQQITQDELNALLQDLANLDQVAVSAEEMMFAEAFQSAVLGLASLPL